MIKRLITLFIPVVLLTLAAPALAQDAPKADQSGASVVILKFETFKADQEVMDSFYMSLHDAINDSDEMYVNEGGEVTINEMLLTMGCEEATPECLSGMRDFVEADRMVFGTVQHSDSVYLFSIKMFDFAEQRFVSQVSDQTVEGDAATIKEAVPAIVEGFVYGDVGSVQVNVDGADAPEVLFDGEKVGRAPLTLDNLPLGEHAVTVRTDSGQEQSQKVLLRRGETPQLDFTIEEAPGPVASGGDSGGGSAFRVPGWILTGVGVAGVAVGTVGMVQFSNMKQDENAYLCDTASGQALCSTYDPAEARAQDREFSEQGSKHRTTAFIGYSLGGAALVAGGYMLYQAYSGDSGDTRPADGAAANNVSVGVAPTKGGASLGLSLDF